jgi:hypothetical protein
MVFSVPRKAAGWYFEEIEGFYPKAITLSMKVLGLCPPESFIWILLAVRNDPP